VANSVHDARGGFIRGSRSDGPQSGPMVRPNAATRCDVDYRLATAALVESGSANVVCANGLGDIHRAKVRYHPDRSLIRSASPQAPLWRSRLPTVSGRDIRFELRGSVHPPTRYSLYIRQKIRLALDGRSTCWPLNTVTFDITYIAARPPNFRIDTEPSRDCFNARAGLPLHSSPYGEADHLIPTADTGRWLRN